MTLASFCSCSGDLDELLQSNQLILLVSCWSYPPAAMPSLQLLTIYCSTVTWTKPLLTWASWILSFAQQWVTDRHSRSQWGHLAQGEATPSDSLCHFLNKRVLIYLFTYFLKEYLSVCWQIIKYGRGDSWEGRTQFHPPFFKVLATGVWQGLSHS